ncbi:MAG TPA: DUF2306 domain-containing protein [Casimicrobiaceae bacterium]|nr:DUF2306 domain-containing protein [Casimicrobiaceae bacterium]
MSDTTAPIPHTKSRAKLVFFLIFALLTVFVAYMKNRGVLDASSPMAQHYQPALRFLLVHGLFGALALAIGVLQLSNRLRANYLKFHRAMGYVYIACVIVAAPFALVVAARIDSPSLVAASGVQAFGWVAATAIAFYCVRNGNIVQHRRWMIRGYAFAMVFTVARLLIPIPPILAMGETGIEIVVWSAIALAAFLPNVLLDWRSIVSRPATKQTMATALEYM